MTAFHHPRSYQALLVFVTLIFGFLGFLFCRQGAGYWSATVMMLLAVFSASYISILFSTVLVDDACIKRVYWFGITTSVRWEFITGIKNRPLLGQYDLVSANGERCFFISHVINDFFELINIVESKARIQCKISFQRSFNKKKWAYISTILSTVIFSNFAFDALQEKKFINFVVFIFITILGIIVFCVEVKRITIRDRVLLIEYPFHSKEINRADVDKISFGYENSQYRSKSEVVILGLINGEEVKMGGFIEGDRI